MRYKTITNFGGDLLKKKNLCVLCVSVVKSAMPHQPKKKSLIPNLPSLPQIDLPKPFEDGLEVVKGARDLISKFGGQVEPALYALLCDKKSPTRLKVDKALKGGTQSAVALLVPLLIAQFALAPAVAALVAAVAVQAIASAGQERLCEELAERQAEAEQTPNSKSQTPKPRHTGTARQRTAKPKAQQRAKAKHTAEAKPKRRTTTAKTTKTKRAKK